MPDVSIFGQIRGSVRQFFATAQQEVQPLLADGGEQLIAEGLPPLTEIVRLGNSWQIIATTGVAALTALPTTVASLSLNNFESGGNGKSLVIEAFGSYQAVIDATQIDSTALFAMLNKKGSGQASAGTLLTSANIGTLSGKGNYGGAAVGRTGPNVINDIWFPHAQLFTPTSPTLAGQIFQVNEAAARGLYVVPPGGTFSMAVVKSVAAAAAQQFPFIRWHEVQLNLG